MKSTIVGLNWIAISSYAVGITAFLSIYAVLTGKKILMFGNMKIGFIALFILGFAMSILAGLRDFPDGKFTMPSILLGILMALGFVAVVLLILMIIGVKIPWIPTYKEAIFVLGAIIITKWSIVHLYKIFQMFF
jgi:hypothetical protein